MEKAKEILFWVGTGSTIVAFILAVVHAFVHQQPAESIINWTCIGFILLSFVAFVAEEVITKKLLK